MAMTLGQLMTPGQGPTPASGAPGAVTASFATPPRQPRHKMPGAMMPMGHPPAGHPHGTPMMPPPMPPPPTGAAGPAPGAPVPGGQPEAQPQDQPDMTPQQAAIAAAIGAALKQSGGDPDQALQTLRREGFTAAAEALRRTQIGRKLGSLRGRTTALALEDAQHRIGMALIKAVTDDATYAVFKQIVSVMVPPLAGTLPQSYAEGKDAVAQLAHLWSHKVKHNEVHQKAAGALRYALATAGPAGDDAPHSLEGWVRAAGALLGHTSNQQQWSGVLDRLRELGTPPEALSKFGAAYSRTGAMRALSLSGDVGLPSSHRFLRS